MFGLIRKCFVILFVKKLHNVNQLLTFSFVAKNNHMVLSDYT